MSRDHDRRDLDACNNRATEIYYASLWRRADNLDGKPMTLDDARAQAEREFGIPPGSLGSGRLWPERKKDVGPRKHR